MDTPRQGHRLVQVGVTLLLFAALLGLAVPCFTVPRLALSAHLVGIHQGIFLVVVGLLWSRLQLGPKQSRIAFWLLIYQSIAAPLSNLLASLWVAGGSIIPMAAGGARGSAAQETVISAGLRSAGAALIVALLLILWGLRESNTKNKD
jgi:(hydroxyamino)benzene mutase